MRKEQDLEFIYFIILLITSFCDKKNLTFLFLLDIFLVFFFCYLKIIGDSILKKNSYDLKSVLV